MSHRKTTLLLILNILPVILRLSYFKKIEILLELHPTKYVRIFNLIQSCSVEHFNIRGIIFSTCLHVIYAIHCMWHVDQDELIRKYF